MKKGKKNDALAFIKKNQAFAICLQRWAEKNTNNYNLKKAFTI